MSRVIFIAAVALATAGLASPPASAEKGREGNAVTRWAEHALDAVRTQNLGTPNAGRLYAMVTVAMYDAVNGIDRARGHGRTHALVEPTAAPVRAEAEVAAAAAAHAVLRGVLRADLPPVSDGSLDAALAGEVDAAGGDVRGRVAAGRDWGASVGGEVVRLRSSDGTQSAQPIGTCTRFGDPLLCEPGEFHAGFDARFRSMTPFGIADASVHRSGPPPALGSTRYAQDYDDVRTCGSNAPSLEALCADPTSPAEREEIADFWLAEGGTVRETGTWMQASLAIADQHGTVQSTADTARLLALVAMAIADAVKASWEAKATYFSWRPTHAIRRAAEDGNPATAPDTSWTSRIATVGGSPEYTSGTSTFAGAASAAIEGFFCGREPAFRFATDMASNGPRSYAGPLEAAREAGRSRIFQGIHFEFSNEEGRRAGRAIGTEIADTRLRPIHGPQHRC